jgi:ABC-2 type transport system permease protein
VSRRRVFVEKSAAVLVAALAIAGLICVGWLSVVPFIDLGDLSLIHLIGATFAQLSLVAFIAATGLLASSLAPTRGTAAAVTGVVLVAAYLAVSIGSAVDAVSWLRLVSPYYYADLPAALAEGVVVTHALVIWTLTLAVGGLALLAFEARELGAEHWQFRVVQPRFATRD